MERNGKYYIYGPLEGRGSIELEVSKAEHDRIVAMQSQRQPKEDRLKALGAAAIAKYIEDCRRLLTGVVELRLCETERVHLKPGQLYLFTVHESCERCQVLSGIYKDLGVEPTDHNGHP